MKKGDIVEIYEDPLIETKLEGKAKLISLISGANAELDLWTVIFLTDDFFCDRSIKKEKK